MEPVRKTLETIELLEQVLLHVPFLDLLQAQQVARRWRNCVKGSLLLQRKLFFAPIPEAEAPPTRKSGRLRVQPVETNPILHNTFQVRHSEGWPSRARLVRGRARLRLNQLGVHEDVSQAELSASCIDLRSLLAPKYDYRTPRPTRPHLPCSRACMLDPASCPKVQTVHTASVDAYFLETWKEMLACQPPLPALTLQCTQIEGRKGAANVVAADGIGVKLGELVVAAAELYRLAPKEGGFRINTTMTIHQRVKCRRPFDTQTVDDLLASDQLVVEKGRARVRLQLPWTTTLNCNLA